MSEHWNPLTLYLYFLLASLSKDTRSQVKSYLWLLLFSPRCHFETSVSHQCLQRGRQLPDCTRKVRTPQAWCEGRCSYPAETARTTPRCSWSLSLSCWTQWHHAWYAVNQTETLYWLSVCGHGEECTAAMNKVASCTSILTAPLYLIICLCQIYPVLPSTAIQLISVLMMAILCHGDHI